MSNVSTFYGQIQNLVFDVLNFEKIAGKGPPPMAMPISPPPPETLLIPLLRNPGIAPASIRAL